VAAYSPPVAVADAVLGIGWCLRRRGIRQSCRVDIEFEIDKPGTHFEVNAGCWEEENGVSGILPRCETDADLSVHPNEER